MFTDKKVKNKGFSYCSGNFDLRKNICWCTSTSQSGLSLCLSLQSILCTFLTVWVITIVVTYVIWSSFDFCIFYWFILLWYKTDFLHLPFYSFPYFYPSPLPSPHLSHLPHFEVPLVPTALCICPEVASAFTQLQWWNA